MQPYSQSTSTRVPGKLNPGRLQCLLMSDAIGYGAWATVTALVMYRAVIGEWFVLGFCVVAAAVCALFQVLWKHIPLQYQGRILICLGALMAWGFLTMHAPAHALFFDTLENALSTLFSRFGVTGVENIPQWIGGVFRIIAVVFLGILALRFGRSRDDDDEGMRAVAGKVVNFVAGLLIFDALIELVIS